MSDKVNRAIAVLKANGYAANDYQTEGFYVSPKYKYTPSGSEIIGQQASQSLTIKVRNLDAKGQKVATLVDALAQINGVNLDSVSFDIFDKTPLQNQARADAFKDAKAKAEDYTQLAGLSLMRLVTIND